MMQTLLKVTAILSVFGLLACTKTVESQMQEYLEFYYPSTGTYYYQIVFEWGDYIIDTGAQMDEAVHKDSEKFKGYITARTSLSETPQGEKLKTYLVTPTGQVWTSEAPDIPETVTREVVIEEKTEYGTSTSTTTINSSMEPVVNHFLNNKAAWKKYGVLKSSAGKTILELEEKQ